MAATIIICNLYFFIFSLLSYMNALCNIVALILKYFRRFFLNMHKLFISRNPSTLIYYSCFGYWKLPICPAATNIKMTCNLSHKARKKTIPERVDVVDLTRIKSRGIFLKKQLPYFFQAARKYGLSRESSLLLFHFFVGKCIHTKLKENYKSPLIVTSCSTILSAITENVMRQLG